MIPVEVRNSGDWIATNVGLSLPAFEHYFAQRTGLTFRAHKPVVREHSAVFRFEGPAKNGHRTPVATLEITYNPASTTYDSHASFSRDGSVVRDVRVPDLAYDSIDDPSLWFSWLGKLDEHQDPLLARLRAVLP